VLLDEPTAGMDPASRRTVWQVIVFPYIYIEIEIEIYI